MRKTPRLRKRIKRASGRISRPRTGGTASRRTLRRPPQRALRKGTGRISGKGAKKALKLTFRGILGKAFTWTGRVFLGLVLLGFCYILVLRFPDPFFRYRVSQDNITLHSDRPLAANAKRLLADVTLRLSRSPVDDLGLRHHIYICNNPGRFLFFANRKHDVGGINYIALGRNVFLRPSLVSRNRMISPSGRRVEGDRTLVYFMAHELTHSLEVHHLGLFGYLRLPEWIKEGYADYVGKGKIDMEIAVTDLRTEAREMDPVKSGLYLRYHLAVAYLLDIREITVRSLFRERFDRAELEKELLELKRFQKKIRT